MERADDTPRGFLDELRSAFWNRRAGQIALAILLAQSGLRLITGFVSYVLAPFISGFVNRNSESVLFPSRPPFAWEAFTYLLLEFGIVLIVFFYAGRALRPKRFRLHAAEELESIGQQEESGVQGSTTHGDGQPGMYTITGEPLNPVEVEVETQSQPL